MQASSSGKTGSELSVGANSTSELLRSPGSVPSGFYVSTFVLFLGSETDDVFRAYFGFEPGTEAELTLTDAQRDAYNLHLNGQWELRAAEAARLAREAGYEDAFAVQNPGTPAICTGPGVDSSSQPRGSAADRSAPATVPEAASSAPVAGCLEGAPAMGYVVLLEPRRQGAPHEAAYSRGYFQNQSEIREAASWVAAERQRIGSDVRAARLAQRAGGRADGTGRTVTPAVVSYYRFG